MKYILTFLLVIPAALAAWFLLVIISSYLVDTSKEYTENSGYYRFLLNASTGICLFFGRIHVHVSGLENVPKDRRFVLVSNHRSKFDPIIGWYVLRKYDIAYISKAENFNVPWFGRMIRRCCFLAIDRENPRWALETVNKAAGLIIAGTVSVGVYPEGTRSKDLSLLPFHNGVFKIAQYSDAPIVIASVRGTEKIHRNFPLHSTDVFFDFIRQIPADEVKKMRTSEIGEEVRECILAKLNDR